MLTKQKLLSIAAYQRRAFFKRWNELSRAEKYFSDPLQKLEFILKDWSWTQSFQVLPRFRFISMLCEDYPAIFWELPQPPLGVFIWGEIPYLPCVSVIGSRKPSSYSLRMTRRCVKEWVERNYCVVSGGAYGIDIEAHRSALDFGGKTIAILGAGFHHLYPQAHHCVFQKIIEAGGALISEYPPDQPVYPSQFPERNRLIAALGDHLFLAQAHDKSGSLSTASTALELGKDIFVLKPPMGNENFAGSASLIERGAYSLSQPDQIDELMFG